jgi:hypothetical protein
MNNVKRAEAEVQEENIPQLRVVASKNGAAKAKKPSAPLVFPSSLHKRPPRPELAVLGWANRAVRLAGAK